MKRTRAFGIGVALVALAALCAAPARGQFANDLKNAVQRGAKREAVRQTEQASAKAVRCLLSDAACAERARSEGHEVVLVDEQGREVQAPAGNEKIASASTAAGPGSVAPQQAAANYDFEPGERVLFREDFRADNAGDFPRRFEFIQGNMQVVDWNGGRWLRADAKNSRFAIELEHDLPERFTIEFDAQETHGSEGIAIALSEPPNFGWAWHQNYGYQYFVAGHRHGSGVWAKQGAMVSTTKDGSIVKGVVPVRIMVDGAHAKMFLGENRVANVPQVNLPRGRKIYFFLEPQTDKKLVYLSNIRIAAGGRDLYDAIATAGRVAVNDILFDIDRATIRPESAEVLGEIGAMLRAHSDLSLLIEGHTDATGDFGHNMALSGERAAAVKSYLVEKHGIEESRLHTMGLGSTRPVDSNETDEGRQQNRRVELVKI